AERIAVVHSGGALSRIALVTGQLKPQARMTTPNSRRAPRLGSPSVVTVASGLSGRPARRRTGVNRAPRYSLPAEGAPSRIPAWRVQALGWATRIVQCRSVAIGWHPTMQVFVSLALVLSSITCAMATDVPSQIVTELAPTGRLRAAINFGNPVLAQKDPATG